MAKLTIHTGKVFHKYIAEANLKFPEFKHSCSEQRIIARDLIAKRVNEGKTIRLVTCSHIIIRELNNLIMLSLKSKEMRQVIYQKYPYYNDSLILNPSDILAYEYDKLGNINLCEISDEGIILTETDKEISELNESSDMIFYSDND